MAVLTAKDNWLGPVLCVVCKWLQSHRNCLFLGITFLFIMVTWISMNMSDVIVDTSYPDIRHGFRYVNDKKVDPSKKPPSLQDIEHRKHVAVFSRILQKQMVRQRKEGDQTQCIHPKLDLKYDTNKFAFYDMPPLNCTGNSFFFAHKGVLVLNKSRVLESELAKCSFYEIDRIDDDVQTYKKPVIVESPPFEAKIDGDFVHILCSLKSTIEENKRYTEEEKANRRNKKSVDRKGDEEYPQGTSEAADTSRRNEENETDEDDYLDDGSQDVINDNGNSYQYRYLDYTNVDPDLKWDFEQFLVQIHPEPEVFQRITKFEAASKRHHPMKLNVLMFALDSMSHLSYQRKLPKTYKYLKDELEATILENYNIVGDATTAAIIPMMTGRTEVDLPDVREAQFHFEPKFVDERYPLVWKKFKKHGYVTLYAEDEPSLGTFNLRLSGFNNIPTDHYMRPFWQAVWDSGLQRNSQRFCSGDIAHHHFMLHYLEDFFVKYRNVSKFAFGFHGELTHADNNPGQYIDAELFNFLQFLKQGKFLDDTVLMVFSDHGARYSKVRRTVQGKLEERLPLMSLVFPRKFRQQYPHLYKNLQTNTQRLTTPFDIHETLLDILNLTEASKLSTTSRMNPGISLLKEIPAGRTCADAGIAMHWCSCLHQINVETTEDFVKPVVLELVQYLNAQTSSHRDHCAKLRLKKLVSVQIVVPNEQVLKFLRSIDDDQRVANFSHEIDLDVVHYQLQVEMLPCGGIFEATVMADYRNHTNYQYTVTPGISRINMYGSQPKCVQDKFPLLRKFCCCLD